jgi:glutaredoxin
MLKVFSKSNCPYCDKAKHLLESNNIPFEVVDIEQDPAQREWLIGQGHRSVPQIYKGEDIFVEGGYQGLARLTAEQLKEEVNA